METLQILALIAAIAKPSLRDSLDVEDFDGRTRLAAKAVKDGRSKEAKEDMKRWLESLGVSWDGKSGIAEAVIATLHEKRLIQRAETQLEIMRKRLRFPNIAGVEAVEEARRILKAIEESKNANGE